MMQLYLDHAHQIRAVAYTILTGYFVYWSASMAIAGLRLQALILLLVSIFWVGSLHFTLSQNQTIALFFTTPILLLLALCCIVQVIVNRTHE